VAVVLLSPFLKEGYLLMQMGNVAGDSLRELKFSIQVQDPKHY
jgi:hypothetical protein